VQVWESKCQDDEEIPTTQVLFIEKTCHVTRLVNRILKVQSAIRNSGLKCGPKASDCPYRKAHLEHKVAFGW